MLGAGRGAEARKWRAACAQGDLAGCAYEASALEHGWHGLTADAAKAARLRESLCERGHAPACTALGRQRQAGSGVDVDARAAVALFDRGCTLGDLNGCSALAGSYAAGYGVPKDWARALELRERVCRGDRPRDCLNTARGLWVPSPEPDYTVVVRFAELGCAGLVSGKRERTDYVRAQCCELAGRLLLSGEGVALDRERAEKLLALACEHGMDLACIALAESLEEEDRARAVVAYRHACDRGYRPACRAAERLEGKTPPAVDDPDFLRTQEILIHPELPPFEFRLFGGPYGHIFRIEHRRPGTEPVEIPWLEDEDTTVDNATYMEPPARGGEGDLRSVDLNFDGHQDLLLLAWEGATGNRGYSVWIYDPPTGRFVPNRELRGVSNPRPEPECEAVSTFERGGAAGMIFVRDSYRWIDGKAILVRRIHQDVIRETGRLRATIYALEEGELKAVKTLEGSWDEPPELGPCG